MFLLHEVALQVNTELLLGSLLELKHVFYLLCISLSPGAVLLCNTVFRHWAVPPSQPVVLQKTFNLTAVRFL